MSNIISNILSPASTRSTSPVATYDQRSRSANEQYSGRMTKHSVVQLQPVDLTTWDDGAWADPIFSETHPDELDRPWPYRFMNGDSVWICASDGGWHRGRVVGQAKKGMTRCDIGLFWRVEFLVVRSKVRKWFSPLNGNIKPDTENTYQLLSDAGWLESDSDE